MNPISPPEQAIILSLDMSLRLVVVADIEIVLVQFDEDQCEIAVHNDGDDEESEDFGEKLYEGVVGDPHVPVMLVPEL